LQDESDDILTELRNIPCGTIVKILWIDASTVKEARLRKPPIRNDHVETRRSTVGTLICVQQGQVQKAWHVVLEMDQISEESSQIRSIPVCLIYRIITPSLKKVEAIDKSLKRRRFARLRHRSVVREMHLSDGSVKYLD
jgi:hypothetical protein